MPHPADPNRPVTASYTCFDFALWCGLMGFRNAAMRTGCAPGASVSTTVYEE